MELRPPREDPYSSVNHALEELNEKGYTDEYTVRDEHTLEDKKGNVYKDTDLSIDEIHRLVSKANKSDWQMVIAINAANGSKGVLVTSFGKDSNEIADRFLRNMDRSDEVHKNY